jgi:hypothetical protein
VIEVPFPPASLAGHNKGRWQSKNGIVEKYRRWAMEATLAVRDSLGIDLAGKGDIRVSATFYPPDRRGDRLNYLIRMKPIWDGIAAGLAVNDKRFVPTHFHFAEPVKNPRVVVTIGSAA